MRLRPVLLLPAFFASLGFVAQVASADPGDTADLEGLLETQVVSAPSKTAEASNLSPATSIVLTAEDLRRYGIRSIDEAINFLGYGLSTEKSFQSSEIGARGVLFASDFGGHVLLMVDGHVLNEQWGATAYFDRGTAIPLELIDHVELVLGPGSVLYGSNAMLGIVHIVTKRAKDFRGVHIGVEAEIPTSARASAGLGKEFEALGRRGEVLFGLEHFEQNGPIFEFPARTEEPDAVTGAVRHFDVDPRDRRYPPGTWGGRADDAYYTHEPAVYLRVRLGDFELGARAALYERAFPTNSGNFDDPSSFERDRWVHLDLKHSAQLSSAFALSTRLYADTYRYDQFWTSNGAEDCLEGQDEGCLWHLLGEAQWLGLEPQLSFDWFEDGRATLLVGVDGRLKQIESTVNYIDNVSGESPGAIGAYDELEKALAAYAQQTFWVTQAVALNAGVRLDVDDRFGSAVSPRAAVTTLPWSGGTVKLMYSEAFRAPTAFDLYYTDPTTQIAGGDLDPETVRSVEASVEQRFGSQALTVALFHSWWDDLLLLQELAPEEVEAALDRGDLDPGTEYAYQVQNVAAIRSFGANLAYQGSLLQGRLRYGASVNEGYARSESAGLAPESLALAPRVFGNARISYDLSNGLPVVALATRYMGPRLFNDPAAGLAEELVELRATLSGPLPVPGLSYRVTGNYITTKYGAYVVHGGASDDPVLSPNDQLRAGVGLAYDLPL